MKWMIGLFFVAALIQVALVSCNEKGPTQMGLCLKAFHEELPDGSLPVLIMKQTFSLEYESLGKYLCTERIKNGDKF